MFKFRAALCMILQLTFGVAFLHCSAALAQIPEPVPVTSALDDLLRSGTNFGNKAYQGLLGADSGHINMATPEGITVIERANGVSSQCIERLQVVLREFGESDIARNLPLYGWGNTVLIDLRKPISILGSGIASRFYERAYYNPNLLTETSNTRMALEIDSECQTAAVVYSGEIPTYATGPRYVPLRVTSTLRADLGLLNVTGQGLRGLAKISHICHRITVELISNETCSPNKIDVYCRVETCYSEPLKELVKSGKIRSSSVPAPLYDKVRAIEVELFKVPDLGSYQVRIPKAP